MAEQHRRRAERSLRIREDLEGLGVSPEFSGPVAARLASLADDLSGDEYAAVLEGVATAYGVHQERRDRRSDSHEILHLVEDFAIELKKLDEGLRILTSYLSRLRDRSEGEPRRLLH